MPRDGPKFWTAARRALLGRYPDSVVARMVGRKVTAVRQRRRSLGIRGFNLAPPPVTWTPEFTRLLGRMPDRELAAIMNVGEGSVVYKRRALVDRVLLQPQRPPRSRAN